MFVALLERLAAGDAVTLVPVAKELTTQQAAELLGVSRPHLIELLESNAIPFRRVGTHRRIRFRDLIEFKRRDDESRAQVADELAREAEELGIEY
jgi:excisionase family DNA binding protein